MRTALRLAVLVLVPALGASAFARELDEHGNTSLSAAPVRTTSASMRMQRGKKEQNVPAKYDVAYPVHDAARGIHERGSI